jgi:hypothetical protein
MTQGVSNGGDYGDVNDDNVTFEKVKKRHVRT